MPGFLEGAGAFHCMMTNNYRPYRISFLWLRDVVINVLQIGKNSICCICMVV